MKLIFIRHGKTAGNLQGRYIGRSDEPLCDEGRRELMAKSYPAADTVIVSPMSRCIETAELIYPDREPLNCEGLRECDFGDFEGKNYAELSGSEDYQRWIDSGGEMAFPGGESKKSFSERTVAAFEEMIAQVDGTVALVVHGGTIMALLERFALPKREFYDYHVKNGGGYVTEYDGKNIRIVNEL